MCARCGEVTFGQHSFSIAERPPQSLSGLIWEGTFAEAAAGAIRRLIEKMTAFAIAEGDPFGGTIVGISWNDRPDRFRYFVGTEVHDGHASPDGDRRVLSMPAMRFASVWHGPDDGDVIQHYGRMIDWIERNGGRRDVSLMHHREEYPSDVDLAGPPVLRLMLPLAPDSYSSWDPRKSAKAR